MTRTTNRSMGISSFPARRDLHPCGCAITSRRSRRRPDLNLHIVANRELDQANERGIDVFIVFGEGGWPKHHVQHLYDVEFAPLCSPALLNVQGGLTEPLDLLRFPLLHLNTWDDWRQWLTVAGVPWPRRGLGIRFSDLMMVQTAAIAGQGVMMGDGITCAGALAAGQLVAAPSRAGCIPCSNGRGRSSRWDPCECLERFRRGRAGRPGWWASGGHRRWELGQGVGKSIGREG